MNTETVSFSESTFSVDTNGGCDFEGTARKFGYPLINNLPPELLQTIFTYLLSESANPDPKTGPLLVSHVCSSWRAAAMGLPSLWNTLSLSFGSRRPISALACENTINISRLWFENASPTPISLSMEFLSAPGASHVLDYILIPYFNRIAELKLLNLDSEALKSFLTLPHGHVDALECLTLDLHFPPYVDKAVSVFRSAPRLRKVFLKHLEDRWHITDTFGLFLPWNQLTHLDVRSFLPQTTRQWRALFRTCVLLMQCHFSIWLLGTVVPVYLPQAATVFPNISTISIETTSRNNGPLEIEEFSFPNLTELNLRHLRIDASWIDTYCQMLQFHSLNRLSLDACPISSVDLSIILKATPLVTDARLSLNIETNREDASRLWNLLTIANTDSDSNCIVLPRLRILSVWIWLSTKQSILPKECAMMVKSRWNPLCEEGNTEAETSIACLQRMALHAYNANIGELDEMKKDLVLCISEGLDVLLDKQRCCRSSPVHW